MPRPWQQGGAPGSEPVTVSLQTALTRRITWLSWFTLLLQQAASAWVQHAPWIVWLAFLLPLVIFIPGMLRDNPRTFIWLCFVSLLYFMRLVVAIFARPDDALAVIGLIAVVVLFCAAMMHVRWRAREIRAG